MSDKIKVAIIGLDTSHSVQFAERMNSADCKADQKVDGMIAISCLRFETPFQDKAGLDERQKQLEEWGVVVTENFDDAVCDCDAIMLEINDPAYHLEYFKKSVEVGVPIFLDKPFADNIENGKIIYNIIKEKNAKVFSSSSLRYVDGLAYAISEVGSANYVTTYGPLGKAPAGSSIVWYGVHSFEMLQKAIGSGATTVTTVKSGESVVCVVNYDGIRRGVVELTDGVWLYGGTLKSSEKVVNFTVNSDYLYVRELKEVEKFFRGEKIDCTIEDGLEVMAMIDAAERSFQSGMTETI